MQRFINACYEKCKDILTKHSKEVHLIANTLLEMETLELEQIKNLIETGSAEGNGSSGEGEGEGSSENGEPIIDNIGDVKVRIQGKEDGRQPAPTDEIPNNPMGPNDPEPESKDSERKDPPGGSDGGNSSLT